MDKLVTGCQNSLTLKSASKSPLIEIEKKERANLIQTAINSLSSEQKAVVILLSLLHLGINDIRLGPSLPAFVTPNVLNVLVENFNIMPTAETAEEDLKAILG